MKRGILIGILAAVAVIGAHAVLGRQQSPPQPTERAPTGDFTPLDGESTRPVVVRDRDRAPAPSAKTETSAVAAAARGLPTLNDPVGSVQPVAEHTNPMTESVVEAERSGEHPERLSALIAPKPFDREAFFANPKAYLDVVEPARVYQSAEPSANVPVLQAVGPTGFAMRQDGEAVLRVRTQPNWPVSFTSFDMGRFGNQLATQTVQADARGVAAVRFLAGPGTIAGVNILAGSPGASGQIRFFVNVEPAVAAVDAAPSRPATTP